MAAPRHILTILAVTDLSRAVRFYRDAFGWSVRVEVPVYVEFELPDGRGFGLYKREGFARNVGRMPSTVSGDAITATEVYLHVDDLREVVARLEKAGARTLSALAPRDWGDEAAYFSDPDGNVLVVARPLGVASLSVDFDRARGRVSIRSLPYLLIQPATLVEFQKAAEASGGEEAASWLASGGREGGRASSVRLRGRSTLHGRDFAQAYLNMGAEIGWGVFKVTRFEDRQFEVEVIGSPFAEAYGKSLRPVCHFTRGVIAGLGDTLFGRVFTEEVECAATGAKCCRFVCHD